MAKGIMYIDGQRVPFDGEKNVLAVIRKAGIEMPTFCYYSELSVYGACRMCVVEDERGKIDASCSMEPRDGMEIRTNTARLLRHRRMILELLLAAHDCSCTTCAKSGNCRLQELALRFGVTNIPFEDTRPHYALDETSPAIVRDPGISVSPTISPGTRRITPATRCSGTPTSASCAATACGCARSCRDRAF